MYLLDTVVLSELRKRRRDHAVATWIDAVPLPDLFLSTITIAKIERGIELQRASNPRFASEISEWLELVLRAYGDRILPLSLGAARRWGKLSAQLGNRSPDLAIAAIALEHGLVVATRNVSDFARTGVQTFNPFAARS